MSLSRENLPQDRDRLVDIVVAQAEEIRRLREILKVARAQIHGGRSERSSAVLEDQRDLDLGDLETQVSPRPANENAAAGVAARPSRKPASRNIGFLPKHLERIDEIIEPATTVCLCCAGNLHRIGADIAEALDSVPAILRVIRTIRPKYACRACEGPIVQAPAKLRLFDGGMATTSLLVSIAVWKYAWYMPLARQMDMLKGQGVTIDRSTACRWMKRLAWYLTPLYDLQLKSIHSHQRLFCDETRMPVRRSDRKTVQICQFWSHAVDDRPWGGPAPPGVVYVFSQTRAHREIKAQLADYQGVLQVDAYSAYNRLARPGRSPGPIRLAFCWAHARRKWTDIYKARPLPLAQEVIERIAAIYAVEADIRGRDADHRRQARQERTAPLIADLNTLMEKALPELSRQSKSAKAIGYCLKHWAGLCLFLDDGRLEIDNNTVERSMRPISLGRKNSLFAGSDGGAETWAILASLLNTAKLNGLDPYTYLSDVVERIVSGQVKNHALDQLLAWNWKPKSCAVDLAVAA
jgi:transposase